MKLNSIRTKLLLIVSSALLASTVAIFFIADKQLTAIIDSSQNTLYREKIDAIWNVLQLSNERLEKTGLIDAYLEDFQKDTLKELEQTYYTQHHLSIYPFIMDTSGNMVLHPFLPAKVSSPNMAITEGLLAADSGEFEAVYEKQTKYYSFRRFPAWNWVIGYAVPLDIKYADARKFRNLLIVIMGSVILAILLILVVVIYRFTKPIDQLTQAAIAVSNGNLDQEIDLRGKDEIGLLADSFKHMCVAVKQTIYELELENADRKSAEIELAREKEQLAVTLRSIGDGVVTTDIAGNIVLINRVAEQLTGWNIDEAVGRNLSEVLRLVNRKTARTDADMIARIMAQSSEAGVSGQEVLLSRNGEKMTIASSATAIRDEQNRIIGTVVVFRDITDQLKIEQELLKNNKLESIGVLAGGIAHDFNNLLAAILGNINLVLVSADLSEKVRKRLSEAEKASIRAKGLTQQLLTFSTGGSPIKEVSALEGLIREAAEFSLHGQPVDCRFHIPEELWTAEIDKDQIAQVIQNIVMNAAQAISHSGMIDISCSNIIAAEGTEAFLARGQKYIRIAITDSGPGIPAAQIDRIFDPFFTTKAMGSGMGLAICHSIISQHEGSIKVDSTPGAGTTFTIYLPAAQQSRPAASVPPGLQHTGATQATIMIMDDEEQVRLVAAEMLRIMGHKTVLVVDGAEALDLYKKSKDSATPIDIVIMDLTIPGGMGGQEAVKEVLAFDPAAKVIVSSGYSNDPVMSHCTEYGFCAAIVKPYRLQQFATIIEKTLKNEI